MREKRGLFDWVWSIARISLVILLLYLWLRYQEKQEQGPIQPIELKDQELPPERSLEKPVSPSKPVETRKASAGPDDLTCIKGIGPKSSSILQAAGISTYQKLADTGIQEIRDLLEKANYRLLDPTTWIEQARLAAKGEWGELEKLQETI